MTSYKITPFREITDELFEKNPTGIVAEEVLYKAREFITYALKHSDLHPKDYKSAVITRLAEGLEE